MLIHRYLDVEREVNKGYSRGEPQQVKRLHILAGTTRCTGGRPCASPPLKEVGLSPMSSIRYMPSVLSGHLHLLISNIQSTYG